MKRLLPLLIGLALALAACAMAPLESQEAAGPLPLSLEDFVYQGVLVGETTGGELAPLLGEPDRIESGAGGGQSEITAYTYKYGDAFYLSSVSCGDQLRLISIMGPNAPPFSRDIKCGDSLDNILAKFAANSITEPKNWYDADYYPRAELSGNGKELALQLAEDAPLAYLYFDDGALLSHLEILATAPCSLLHWQLRERALLEEIPLLEKALRHERTIDYAPLDEETRARYQKMLEKKLVELMEAQEQIARLQAESGGGGPIAELAPEQQEKLDALLADFSPDTAQAWLEAMLPAFHADDNYQATVYWLDDSKAQGWVLAKAYYYELYHYFYVLADGQLRYMGGAEQDLGLDVTGAPAELVIIDSGSLARINGTHNFPRLISAYWDRPDLMDQGITSDHSDPLTGKTAMIIYSDYWLPLGRGEMYGQDKSATLEQILITDEGLTLVYAHREGDALYVGGRGIPNMKIGRAHV